MKEETKKDIIYVMIALFLFSLLITGATFYGYNYKDSNDITCFNEYAKDYCNSIGSEIYQNSNETGFRISIYCVNNNYDERTYNNDREYSTYKFSEEEKEDCLILNKEIYNSYWDYFMRS